MLCQEGIMVRRTWYIVGALLACVGVPSLLYIAAKPSYEQDKLEEMLNGIGFLPIKPPSNLLTLGSIYAIDQQVRFFQLICPASFDDLKQAVQQSPSEHTIANQLSRTNYSAKLSGKVANFTGSANTTDDFLSKVQLKFTDVNVFELNLERSFEIYQKLMSKNSCDSAVQAALQAGGYACQGRALLQASAEYNVDHKDIKSAALESGIDPAVASKAVVDAAKTGSALGLQDNKNILSTGVALHYGVSMNPTCIAPKGAFFPRVLPRTQFQRMMNFIKFNVLEPVLPSSKL
jgi:hypothetical protein